MDLPDLTSMFVYAGDDSDYDIHSEITGVSQQDSLLMVPELTIIDSVESSSLQDSLVLPTELPLIDSVKISFEQDSLVLATESDTLSGTLPDTLLSAPLDTVPVSIVDTIAETTEAESHSDYDAADMPPAAYVPVITGPSATRLASSEEPGLYDISYYLDNEPDIGFLSKQFAFQGENNKGLPGNKDVFIGSNETSLNNGTRSYISYLNEDSGMQSSEPVYQSTIWMPVFVILSFLLLTWIKLIYVQFITPVLVSAFSYKESARLYVDRNAPAQNAFLILHAIFAINGGIFFMFIAGHFNFRLPDFPPVSIFLIASATIVLVFFLKSVALGITGFLFDKTGIFSEYIHNISLYNKIFGLLLLPVIIGLMYASEALFVPLIYSGLVLALVFYSLQLVRGLEIILRKEVSLFYLILYLCAFEILPILVLYKLFQVLLI